LKVIRSIPTITATINTTITTAGFGIGAIGKIAEVQNILWAVLAHKAISSYALGASFIGGGEEGDGSKWSKWKATLIVVVFALTTPVSTPPCHYLVLVVVVNFQVCNTPCR
jgi:hypothetical protein